MKRTALSPATAGCSPHICSASTRCRASSWRTSRRCSAAPMCSPTTSWRSTPAGISRCFRSKSASWAKRGLTSASPALTSSSSASYSPRGPKVGPIPTMPQSHPRTRSRSRATYGCSAAINCSAATAQWRPTLSACSVASRRTLWSPTRPTALITNPAWRHQAGRSINGTTRRIAAGTVIKPIGARAVGKVVNDDRADRREAWALFPGSVAYIWHAGTKAGIVQDSLAACGFETRSQIIWAKNNFAIGRGHYHCKHEPCWYVVRKGSTAPWVGDQSQTTLWQIDKNLKSETGHGTQKPVECMRRPIENNASPGQAVYEPFSGSGTTIIAAEMTSRVCHAIEIAPAYVDVAVKRWQEFTGQQAVLDGDGRSFDTVAAQRAR